MGRLIGPSRAEIANPLASWRELAGPPESWCLAATGDGVLRVKPRNLFEHLPLARRE